jgi:hypothetical protein
LCDALSFRVPDRLAVLVVLFAGFLATFFAAFFVTDIRNPS